MKYIDEAGLTRCPGPLPDVCICRLQSALHLGYCRLRTFLDHLDVGGYIVDGDLELYSCEHLHKPAQRVVAGRSTGADCFPAVGRQARWPGQEAIQEPRPRCAAGQQPTGDVQVPSGTSVRVWQVRPCSQHKLAARTRAGADASPLHCSDPGAVFAAARPSSSSFSPSITLTQTTTSPSCGPTTFARRPASRWRSRPLIATCWRCQGWANICKPAIHAQGCTAAHGQSLMLLSCTRLVMAHSQQLLCS